MTSIPMNQSLEDKFLHWHQDMERKQEEQARHMKDLQDQAERFRHENDHLRAQIEKVMILENTGKIAAAMHS